MMSLKYEDETVVVSIGKYNINEANLPYQCAKNMITDEVYYIGNKFVPFTVGEKIFKYDPTEKKEELDFIVKTVQFESPNRLYVCVNNTADLIFETSELGYISNKRMLQQNTLMVGRITYHKNNVKIFVPDYELIYDVTTTTWSFYKVNNEGVLDKFQADYTKYQIPSVTYGGQGMSNLLDFINKTHYQKRDFTKSKKSNNDVIEECSDFNSI